MRPSMITSCSLMSLPPCSISSDEGHLDAGLRRTFKRATTEVYSSPIRISRSVVSMIKDGT